MVIGADKYGRVPVKVGCKHKTATPEVPGDEVLHAMDADEVRRKHPRFHGHCPDCGQMVVLYGSAAHCIAGDW